MITFFPFSIQNMLITLILIIITIYLYLKYAFLYWQRKGIPFCQPSMPFGSISPIIFGKDSLGGIARNIYQELKSKGYKYGGYFTVTQPVFMPIDPALIKCMLVTEFSKFSDRGMYSDEEIDPLSAHLASVKNPQWQKLRTTFSPIFTPSKTKKVFPTMMTCTGDLLEVIDELCQNNEPIHIRDILERFTTDVISTCAFGIGSNSLKNPNAEFRIFGKKFFESSLRNSIVLTLSFTAPTVLKLLKIPICQPKLANYFQKIIRDIVEHREKYNIERNDIMDMLIKLKNGTAEDEHGKEKRNLTINEIAAQSFIFYLAGYETSAAITAFVFFELIKNENFQNKMRKEILETLEKHNGEITYESVLEMTYMDQFISETMRMYPPLPFLTRLCVEDFTIPGTDKVIEKGTFVIFSLLGMHHDPDKFENPELFDPERFSEERKADNSSEFYMPWGLGPRSCIGLRFGLLTVKISLIHLLKNYKFSAHPERRTPDKLNKKMIILDFESTLYLKATKI